MGKPEQTHTAWTVAATRYISNLDEEDRRGEHIAIHHANAPRHNPETGGTTMSLIMPTLIVSLYCGQPREVADRVAAILNAHWDTFEMTEKRPESVRGLKPVVTSLVRFLRRVFRTPTCPFGNLDCHDDCPSCWEHKQW